MDVIPQVQQSFTRIDAPSLKAINDTRYKFFIEKVRNLWKQPFIYIYVSNFFFFTSPDTSYTS